MKKIIWLITFIILIFIMTTIIVSFTLINSRSYLKDLKIINVNNISTKYFIKYENVKSADNYEVVIYNNDDSVFYSTKTNKQLAILDLNDIENNKEYKLIIYAYKDNHNIAVSDPYTFTYLEPTFSKNNSLIFTDNENYILKIDGDLTKKSYYLEINYDNKKVKKEQINSNEYIIKNDLFKGKKGVFNIKLYDQNTILNEINIYNNISPVKAIKITNPNNEEELDYGDINLIFTGGDNATYYSLLIYKENILIKKTNFNQKSVIISSEFFEKGSTYTLKVIGKYNDIENYSKSDEVKIKFKEKDTLLRPYMMQNPLYNSGKITLVNPNEYGKILYTINGEDPSISGLEYQEPFTINENATIKTIIISEDKKYNNSEISAFKVNIGNKDKYQVYLNIASDDNSLKEIQNNLKEKLEHYNIKVLTNTTNNINNSISESKYNNVDLYLSLKVDNNYKVWINDYNALSYSFGSLINNKLKEFNSKLKYSYNMLDELSENNVPLSILVSVNDTNTLKISEILSNTILEYFGLF